MLGSSVVSTSYLFDRFRVNVDSLELLRDGQRIALPPKTFDVLVLLVANRHRVLSKEEILKTVWREAFVSDDSLSQCISSLRKTLGDDSSEPAFIATAPRRGYRFIAPVTEEPLSPPAILSVDERPSPTPRAAIASAPRQPRGRWLVAAIVALAAAAAGLAAGMALNRGITKPLRMNLQPPLGVVLTSGAMLSPDGSMAAFVAEDRASARRLWVAPLTGGEPRALAGTEGAAQPFWSPDSRFLGFFASGALKTIEVSSGPPRTIAPIDLVPAGASWSGDWIVFAGFRSSINAVAAAGGAIRAVTTVDTELGDRAHEWPEFLPGRGERFLYSVDSADPERTGTYIGSIDSNTPKRLIADQHAIYAPPGYLVYVRDETLIARRFNAASLEVGPATVTIAGNVTAPSIRNGAVVSAAQGLLSFGGGMAGGRLVWLDRAGQQVSTTHASDVHSPALLPESEQVLVDGNGVWLVDLKRGTTTRLIADGSTPVASPDGSRFVFNAVRGGNINDLYVRTLGGNDDELLLRTAENKLPNDWTRDGRYLVYASRHARTGRDLWLLPMIGDHTPIPFSVAPGNEIQAQVSPDGRWIAYASNESGSWQVYVQSFPKPGNKRAVSPGGGAKPVWRADGDELFYLAPDRTLMAAPVDARGDVGRPEALFQTSVVADLSTYRSQYAVTPDGRRFLFDTADPASARSPITMLVNWESQVAR